MIVGVGTDLIALERYQQMVERRPGVEERLLSADERLLPLQSRAARFAAKEALAKALGSPGGLVWLDCEVVRNPDGAPSFVTRGSVAHLMTRLGVRRVHLSLAHDGGVATAMVVCES